MRKATHHARTSALPAIAAALALSSTTALAQQAQPVATEPPPTTTTDQPAPATQAEPATTDTSAPAPAATTETAQPTDAKTASTTAPKTVRRTTRTASVTPAAKPAVAPRTATRSVTTHAAAPAAAAKTAAVAPAPTPQPAATPVVDANAKPAPAPTAAAKPTPQHDNTLPIAGGALAVLALGGAAVALTRRRRHDEDEWVEEESIDREPVDTLAAQPADEQIVHEQEPAMIAPAASAFSWGNAEHSHEPAQAREPMTEEDDRLPGESWVQRAYRGPTPNNPSVSLRARLKRAAFFDKRERDVAAGRAEPVEMDAGLPDAMVEEQERELA